MSSEELHLKRWFKFSKIHKTIPPMALLKDNTAVNESISYSLYITHINNIQNKTQANLSIRILINLFNTDTKEFFGRTYESPFLDLRESDETQGIYIHDPIIAYFHLKHSIQPPVNVVFEVVLFEKKENVIISRQILGWTLIPLLAAQNQKLTLKRGSSRFLISQQSNFDTTLYSMVLDLDESKEFNEIKFLLAEGCICGVGDEVLGLFQGNIRQMQLLQSQTAFITQIKLMVPVQMELIISENLKKYKELKFRDLSNADVTFVAKRLVTAFHNGWTFTNSRGLNNFVTLEDSPIVQMPVENQKVDYKKLTFSGALDVNNIFTESNLGVFVIQLEYDVEFMVVNMGRQRSTIICGWVPIVPTEEFDEELIVGPGTALNGKVLIDLSDVLCPLQLSGKVNYGGIGVGIPNQQSITNLSKAQLPDFNTNEKKAEYLDDKTKLKMLENTLKSLQQERQLSSTHVAMDFENKLKMDRQKEEEYQKMVDSIKKQHEEEIMQITSQYEELKRMMSDINQTQQQYLTKTQPQASLAMMQQSVLYDQQTLEKWKIVEAMTSVPRKTFYKTKQQQLLVEASYGTKTLSRADLAFLSQNGVRELFQYTAEVTDNDDLKQRSLQYELQDHRQMSLIQIQLLSFKPRITQTSDNLEPQNNYYSEDGRIPQRVELKINFFDNTIYQTETLLFENGFDKNSFQNCLQQQIPFLFIREYFLKTGDSHKEPVFQFTMDPIAMNYPNAYKCYCQYLYNKCMTMELWDSDSRMIYGTIKIPMRALMRQNQDAAFIMKKADIISSDFKNVKGEIQLLVKNIGKEPRESEKLDKNNHTKRKVISTKQLQVQSFVERKDEEINLISNDPDERIKERIRRFKNDSLKTVSLVEINRFKEVKKNAFVRSVIQGHLSEEKVIYPLYGRLEIVPLEFQNPFGSGQNFVIVVDDQELKCSGISEIQVIYQAVEWKYFVDTENYPKPPEFNMIQTNNGGQMAIFLQAKESVTLLIKYLTIREVDTSFKELQKTEDLSLQKGNAYLLQHSYPRQVAIYINTTEGQCVGGLRIQIYPKPNSIDHIYNFYERDNRQVSLLLPAIYGYSVPTPDKRPKLYVTDKQVMCEWANDFEIRVSLRIGEVNKTTTFNLLCYQDTYYRQLLANWQINIFSLAGLGLEVPLGQVQINKLTVHVDLSKQVRFYSSHPLLVWFPQPYDSIVSLLPGKINIINISVRIFIEQIYKIMVTCVDVNSRELVRSWILTIAPTVPPVSQVFDVTCPLDKERNVIVPYQNKLNSEVWMIFVSSNEQILEPLEKRINYKPQQSQNLRIKIFRVGEMQNAEVKLFIGDEDRSRDTYDCILFRITYN